MPHVRILLCLAGALLATASACPARGADPSSAPAADSLRVRFELGVAADASNEQYYEDSFTDTTFLGRQLQSTPETRLAGVFATALEGLRGQGAWSYRANNELSLGDLLQRDALSLSVRSRASADWRLMLDPRLEFRRDRTFDRDRREWRGDLGARIRRQFADEATAVELALGGDFLRANGAGNDFVLDRNAARASLELDHSSLLGSEWRFGYGAAVRTFPDSATRDHLEHTTEVSWRRTFTNGHTLSLEGALGRRVTLREVTVTRDNFWEERVQGEGTLQFDERWSLQARSELEAFQYDREDSTLYFNYHVLRASLMPRFARSTRWSLAAGPRAEILSSPLARSESYREIGGALDFEYLDGGAWWNVSPAAGWRAYDTNTGADVAELSIHSSYAFYELTLLNDQPLPAGLRVRGIATVRLESHLDASQDSRSLYLSLDVRRTF